MLIKSFCICICRIRIRLFAHLWTVACAHPWISPISSTPRPNLRQRMGIIVKWKSFLRKELLVHNFFFCTYAHPPLWFPEFFVHIFVNIFVLLVMTKSYFCVFFVFWYAVICTVFSPPPSLLHAIFTLYFAFKQSLVTRIDRICLLPKKRCLIFW